MTNRLVSDDAVSSALEFLAQSAEAAAAAKGALLIKEHHTKSVRALLVQQAPHGTQGLRDAWAASHNDLQAAVEEEARAMEACEYYRWRRGQAEAVIEVYKAEKWANSKTSNNVF